jgi:hypothetical protein
MQICVKECPKENFAFKIYSKDDWRSKMICKDDVSVSSLSKEDAEKMIDNNKCAGYYIESTSSKNNML